MQNYRPFTGITPAVKILLILNIVMYFLSMFIDSRMHVDTAHLLGLHLPQSVFWRPWQYVTHMFMHGSFGHLFFNMFGLFMFGSTLERVFGPKRFLFYYISVGIGAALVQEGVYAVWINHLASGAPEGYLDYVINEGAKLLSSNRIFTDPDAAQISLLANVPTIGASGAIYGILLAFGMIFPNLPLYLMFLPVPIKAKWMVIGYGVIELTLGVTGLQSGVAHFAHLGGMIIGFAIIWYWKKKGMFHGPLY